ncbi:MAG TPA: hypothetical protein VG433_03980 [Pirellulales bacterium]|jgi:hypothetical protein|nr:hypothetical protein [Pirellulales bacterium]
MAKNLVYALALGGLLTAGGCRMCGHGYEYSSPAFEPGKPPAGFCERRGSILGPGQPAAPGPVDNKPDPQPTLAPVPPAPVDQPGMPGA